MDLNVQEEERALFAMNYDSLKRVKGLKRDMNHGPNFLLSQDLNLFMYL